MTGSASGTDAAARWRAAVSRAVGGATPESLARLTPDGIAVGPLHARAEPAVPQPWRAGAVSIAEAVDHPAIGEALLQATTATEGGADALVMRVRGSRAARGFGVGPEAVPELLTAIDLARVALRVEWPEAGAEPLLARVLEAAGRQGIDPADERLDLAVDPVGLGPAAAVGWARLARDRGVARAFRADGRPHHEAGASQAQELAAVLSAGVAALRAWEEAGGEPRAGLVGVTLAVDADHLVSVAKLRAMRRLWARVEQGCGLVPVPLRLDAETAWRMLATRDAWTNLVRNTVATVAALQGGVDRVTVLPFTAALGLPDASARRLARNTALILIEEAGLARVADPWGGSGAAEALTEALCAEAWRLFQGLEAGGGLPEAMRTGAWPAVLAAQRVKRRAALAGGTPSLVGVTAYPPPSGAAEPGVLLPMPAGAGGSDGGLPAWRDEVLLEASPP